VRVHQVRDVDEVADARPVPRRRVIDNKRSKSDQSRKPVFTCKVSSHAATWAWFVIQHWSSAEFSITPLPRGEVRAHDGQLWHQAQRRVETRAAHQGLANQ